MTDDENAIRDVVKTWMAASQAGDLETILSLMTDDAIFMVPGQEPFGREQFATGLKRMSGMQLEGTSEIVELQIFNGWAFIRNRIDINATPPGGSAIRRSGYALTLMQKGADGRWRLARDANMLTVRQ